MACIYAGCEIAYPYYYEEEYNPRYTKSLDDILEKVMTDGDKIKFDGLEKAYSAQEWNLICRLRQKIVDKMQGIL